MRWVLHGAKTAFLQWSPYKMTLPLMGIFCRTVTLSYIHRTWLQRRDLDVSTKVSSNGFGLSCVRTTLWICKSTFLYFSFTLKQSHGHLVNLVVAAKLGHGLVKRSRDNCKIGGPFCRGLCKLALYHVLVSFLRLWNSFGWRSHAEIIPRPCLNFVPNYWTPTTLR